MEEKIAIKVQAVGLFHGELTERLRALVSDAADPLWHLA